MSLRGNGCIALKLRRAKVKGSKTPRGEGSGVQDSAGQTLKANFSHGVLDLLTFAARSFGEMQPLPSKLTEIQFQGQNYHTNNLKN